MHGSVIVAFAHISCDVLFCTVKCKALLRACMFSVENHITRSTQQTRCHGMSIMRRSPAHCIEYAHLIQWGRDRPDDEFDADIEEHMKWMYKHALARAEEFGIQASPAAHPLHSLSAIMLCAFAACCRRTCAVTGMCTWSFCCSCMSTIHLLSWHI